MRGLLLFLTTSALAADTAAVQTQGSLLNCAPDGKLVCSYQMEAGEVPAGTPAIFRHGAHLHPIYSPAGKIVTGNHPADHPWHRGLWMAWTKTEFGSAHPDFWNQGKSEEKGKQAAKLSAEVRFDSLVKTWAKSASPSSSEKPANKTASAGFTSKHLFLDHSGEKEHPVLSEEWQVITRQQQLGKLLANVIDLTSTQRCASATALHLPEYHYGGLGLRGNEQWADHVTMLTSEGHDRLKGDSTRARWVWMGGKTDGADTGIAVLIHPTNFRFPQPLRLNPKNPQLCVAPSQLGAWDISPGKDYVSSYRILVVDAEADAEWIEQQWKAYAAEQ